MMLVYLPLAAERKPTKAFKKCVLDVVYALKKLESLGWIGIFFGADFYCKWQSPEVTDVVWRRSKPLKNTKEGIQGVGWK